MLLEKIIESWDPTSRRCGKLIQSNILVWHYSVALSDDWAIAWGPDGGNSVIGRGRLCVHKLTPNFLNADNVDYLPLENIYNNIIKSVKAFHNNWWYGVQGWNCEHWARLAVSERAVSYQVSELGWGIFDLFGNLRRHWGAEETLRKTI